MQESTNSASKNCRYKTSFISLRGKRATVIYITPCRYVYGSSWKRIGLIIESDKKIVTVQMSKLWLYTSQIKVRQSSFYIELSRCTCTLTCHMANGIIKDTNVRGTYTVIKLRRYCFIVIFFRRCLKFSVKGCKLRPVIMTTWCS